MADLVGAVRLPSGAHRRAAGTDALTDLLILRRREPGVPPRDLAWETVTAASVDGTVIKTNTYFSDHPEHVLGELHVGSGMYDAETVYVQAEDLTQTASRLRDALGDITSRAIERGDVFTAASVESVQERAAAAQTNLWDGTIVAVEGGFQIAHSGRLEPFSCREHRRPSLRALLGLRDGARALLDAEAPRRSDDGGAGARRGAPSSHHATCHRDIQTGPAERPRAGAGALRRAGADEFPRSTAEAAGRRPTACKAGC